MIPAKRPLVFVAPEVGSGGPVDGCTIAVCLFSAAMTDVTVQSC